VQVSDCEPHAILLTPVYVYLLQNQKFVAIKGPLTFFEPSDLDKYKSFEHFYLPSFIDQLAPFQKVGRLVHDLLQTRQTYHLKANDGRKLSVVMPVPQYELDDAILRAVGPLWSEGIRLEPFFLCVVMEEICEPLAAEVIEAATEKNADLFELALLRASAAVFLALHLGYCDTATLRSLRDAAFENTLNDTPVGADPLAQLIPLVRAALPVVETRMLSITRFIQLLRETGADRSARNIRKLISRLTRVGDKLIRPSAAVASLYGEKGLLDE
jgi:hypothetical protein